MENELKKLQRQVRRTRNGGIFGFSLLSLAGVGTLYYLKESHHCTFGKTQAIQSAQPTAVQSESTPVQQSTTPVKSTFEAFNFKKHLPEACKKFDFEKYKSYWSKKDQQ